MIYEGRPCLAIVCYLVLNQSPKSRGKVNFAKPRLLNIPAIFSYPEHKPRYLLTYFETTIFELNIDT